MDVPVDRYIEVENGNINKHLRPLQRHYSATVAMMPCSTWAPEVVILSKVVFDEVKQPNQHARKLNSAPSSRNQIKR